ncbi:hypothetical protein EK21DRAFT_54694 [Setomelanomma holmii]|uniref:Trichothecene 3-O-acetyltransferase-like N-terminal domain-containing protein n=1 Tax=Setomelanomma holmii TaxID=210430 RepID=A0A9P4HHH5_9PLEO|nr:hypothetical protein EK21DRAFT_54694 [Setomelanomma holmii]
MPKIEEFQLHPYGWESDPQEERFRLSTLDYLATTTWTNTALFFKLNDDEKMLLLNHKATEILKQGLERTLSQVRQFVGTIERDEDGQHSIVRKRTSTVRLVVQHLDTPDDSFPAFEEIAKAYFLSPLLGDIDALSNLPMTCGNKPEAHPDNSPAITSYKVNNIRGGIIFNTHDHHYANGLVGKVGFLKQLAENCYAIAKSTQLPSWDMNCLDRARFGIPGFDKPSSSKEQQIEAPPRALKNTQHRPSQALMFHLPKSKAQELKKAASPSDGSRISTFDAIVALMWRVQCRIREPIYKPGLDYKPLYAQGVSIAKLFKDVPARLQGNLQIDVSSTIFPNTELTLAEIISDVPLSKLATYTRRMTDSVTQEMLTARLEQHAAVRNKHDLSIRVESFPPLALLVSDWRMADLCKMDYGFAEPSAWRHLFGGVPLCQSIVYPPHKGPAGDEEGLEVQFTFEHELVPQLLKDPDWMGYFEFRGVDAWEEERPSDPKSKL